MQPQFESVLYFIIGIIIGCAVIYFLLRKRQKQPVTQSLDDSLVKSIAALLQQFVTFPSGVLQKELKQLFDGGTCPDALQLLLQAEYTIEKIDSDSVKYTVAVLLQTDADMTKFLSSEMILDLDTLPDHIRDEFIRGKKISQTYQLYPIMTFGKPIPSGQSIQNKIKQAPVSKDTPPVLTFIPRKPQYTLEQVILPNDVAEQIKNLLKLANPDFRKLLYDIWELRRIDPGGGNTAFLFYGPPGTGKTMCVEAFANELGREIIDVSYSQIESKYVGETGKNIVTAFEAAEKSGAVLFFDEADSILGSRMSNVTQAADQAVNVARAVMLKELDTFNGIVTFATNFAKNIDSAFVRRIGKHIEIPLPIEKARLAMFQKMVSVKVPGRDGLDWNQLVSESEGFSGGDIKNAVVCALVRVADSVFNQTVCGELTDIFVEEIALIRKSKANVGKPLPVVREEIVSIEQAKREFGKEKT